MTTEIANCHRIGLMALTNKKGGVKGIPNIKRGRRDNAGNEAVGSWWRFLRSVHALNCDENDPCLTRWFMRPPSYREPPKPCPVCQVSMQADETDDGTVHQCPKCGVVISIVRGPKRSGGMRCAEID